MQEIKCIVLLWDDLLLAQACRKMSILLALSRLGLRLCIIVKALSHRRRSRLAHAKKKRILRNHISLYGLRRDQYDEKNKSSCPNELLKYLWLVISCTLFLRLFKFLFALPDNIKRVFIHTTNDIVKILQQCLSKRH